MTYVLKCGHERGHKRKHEIMFKEGTSKEVAETIIEALSRAFSFRFCPFCKEFVMDVEVDGDIVILK